MRSARWRVLASGAAWVAALLYLARFLPFPPNQADGGLLLDYIRLMAEGQRPFFDFIDIYGPLNWVVPVLLYRIGDEAVWGVRLWVLGLKGLSVVLGFRLVDRLVGRLPAWLAALWLTVLLGAPWQLLQTPYAMHSCLPLSLAIWLLLLGGRRAGAAPGAGSPSPGRIALAGILTGVALWTKLNTGAFLLAGGLFYCLYWMPGRSGADAGGAAPRWFVFAAPVGLGVYGLVFLGFVGADWNTLYFFYVVLPLLGVLGLTARELLVAPPDRERVRRRLGAWGLYLAAAAGFVVLLLLAYFGVADAGAYLAETAAILARLDYAAPFPPLGQPGKYVGLNEYFWPQLPWLVTVGFALVWLVEVRAKGGRGDAAAPVACTGLFVLFTFLAFVSYSRADEAHLVQAVWPAVPAVFVMFGSVWNRLGRPGWLSAVLVGGALLLIRPLWVPPSLDAFPWGPGEWHSPRLRQLRFHPVRSPYIADAFPSITNFDWDVAANRAARHIDRVTNDGDPVLVSLKNELLTFNSNTTAVGGRYRYVFYLIKQELIDGEAFRELVPPEILEGLLENPPPVIVDGYGAPLPLFAELPELARLREREYELTGTYRHILVYEHRPR